MTGVHRERSSEHGDGDPIAGTSSRSSFPEADADATPHWEELADAVWLAAYWDRHGHDVSERTTPGSAGTATNHPHSGLSATVAVEQPSTPSTATSGDESNAGASSPRWPAVASARGASGGTAPQPRLLPDPEGAAVVRLNRPLLPDTETPPGTPGPGRETARLARALHRLARRVPSRVAKELDEETTAERGIVDGLWMPFLQPSLISAFDLVLLIDDSLTMRIWEDATARLAEAAEQSGAFRAVRVVRVTVPRTGAPTVRRGTEQAPADPAELLDGSGNRVFLVVTDGLAHGWAGAAADALLGRLGRAGPTALVHLLPHELHRRSSLYPYSAELAAGGFGATNESLEHRPPPGGRDPMRPLPEGGDESVPVPVLSLRPGSLAAWAELVTGKHGVRRELPVVLAGTLAKGAPAQGLDAPRIPRAATAAVRRFFALATPAARRLAGQLAAIPFEFELVDQFRKRFMPETRPDHLAEILMGGLIDWNGGGEGQPEFAEGVREALLASTTRTGLALTVSALGDLPAAGRRGVALRAALRDPEHATLPDPAERNWVRTELAVMRSLSGPYAKRAKRLEPSLPRLAPSAAKPPSISGSSGSGAGSEKPESGVPDLDPLGVRVASPVTDTSRTEAPKGELPMTSPKTGTPAAGALALMVNVPLRNNSFVGRMALLQGVEDQLNAQDTAAVLPHALHGLGGVGKSQLALEYVHRHQRDYELICWIPAERESLILAALAGLAVRLRLTPAGQDGGGGVPAANTAVPAVLEALRTGVPYDKWLLIFDNAENVEVVRNYFPANGPGKIIVTSRNPDWERVATPLPVNVFEREESIELLQKRSPDLSLVDADLLAAALGDLPLAVEQAGAWRAVTGMLVEEYLNLLEQRSPEILHLDPAPDYPVSVAAAWDISLERIKENNPGARELLDICACMAPEPVPLSMLRKSRGGITPNVDPVLSEAIKLARAIRALTQFSLVKLDLRTDTLQMHRLLQNVLLAKQGSEERERMRNAAHQLLSVAKPGHYASSQEWPDYQALLPHVLSSQAVTSTDTFVRELVYDTVLFLYYWGDHVGAADLARQAYTSWLAASGEENIHVIRISKILAFLLRVVGEAGESIELNERALELSRRVEVDQEDLIDSMIELADARRFQGRFVEARDLGREATERARTQLGPDDAITMRAAHSWGVDLRLCGQFREALPMDQETARLREELLGPASSLTLNTLNALAIDMRESGDYPGARTFQEDVYRQARAALGDDNFLTLRIAGNLAVCRRRDGAITDAAKLADETLSSFVAGFGRDHSDSLSMAINVSIDRRLTGDLDGARRLGEQTLKSCAQRFGDNHAYTLLMKANLAAILRALGDLPATQEYEDAAVASLVREVGPRHVTTLTAAIGQATTAHQLLDFDRAREIDEANLPLLTEAAGPDHPLTLSCASNLALDLRGLGRGTEADGLERRAVKGFRRVVREDHPWLLAAGRRRRIECDIAPMPL
ncbi:FxSxx-COOH system tetratricopeptide repeat protein [Streptomyces sp. ActVer]|uniref:FxSxx-COOH system tetratricopeptide repeat protein n=1 Tax=Streptomyces sp. ActVer TaxID=3014558 RepID=UPI0022B470C1|nr:FxSxx-COOH system tetratricopeptide repeat protein [Streptomyces sp. ActVer]MCZ4510122.1 FxSxx-COOH system tetratricopeptide repeat protein [Streptomyces sp. ActVer]